MPFREQLRDVEHETRGDVLERLLRPVRADPPLEKKRLADPHRDPSPDAPDPRVARPEPIRARHADRQDRGPTAQGEKGDAVLGLLEGPGRAPGALGEGPQHAAVLQDRAGQPEGLRVGGAALDPERAVLAHEPAGQGPVERLRLRHPVHRAPQGRSQPARDERRVPVADVVGREDQRPRSSGHARAPGP